MQDLSDFHDVVIAGAGPVGLFLACELRLGGCSVLVLERERDPHPPLKQLPLGRRGLSVLTIESFDRRGLLEQLGERTTPLAQHETPHWMRQQARQPAGHFAGIQFFHDQIDRTKWAYRLPESVSNLSTDMASIEAVLTARSESLGVQIRRDCRADGFTQSEDGVNVDAGGDIFLAGWLVGCDGGRSLVRKAADIGFSGTEPEFTGYSALVTLADPDKLKPGRHYTAAGMYMFTPPGMLNIADFDGGAFHRADAITPEHLEGVLRRVSGTDVTVTSIDIATTWTDRAFQATEYRKGRVLLAGDAAHVHSPLGGQGLNLGLGDAMNLGWKLAATIRGNAPTGLLESYHRERHPVGAQILDWSRAQVALMRPSRSSRALEAIIRDLIDTGDGATYFAERVWGVGQRYNLGDTHPLVGRSAPDFRFSDGTRLNDHLRSGQGLLVEFDESARLRRFVGEQSSGLRYIGGDPENRPNLSALLVRPDGIVAWACDGIVEEKDLRQEIFRWFR